MYVETWQDNFPSLQARLTIIHSTQQRLFLETAVLCVCVYVCPVIDEQSGNISLSIITNLYEMFHHFSIWMKWKLIFSTESSRSLSHSPALLFEWSWLLWEFFFLLFIFSNFKIGDGNRRDKDEIIWRQFDVKINEFSHSHRRGLFSSKNSINYNEKKSKRKKTFHWEISKKFLDTLLSVLEYN